MEHAGASCVNRGMAPCMLVPDCVQLLVLQSDKEWSRSAFH